jgi:hypothetical protein
VRRPQHSAQSFPCPGYLEMLNDVECGFVTNPRCISRHNWKRQHDCQTWEV